MECPSKYCYMFKHTPYKKPYEEDVKSLSHIRLSVNPWTVACQIHLSMDFSRQEHWVVPFFRESSQSRDRTWVTAGRFFTI